MTNNAKTAITTATGRSASTGQPKAAPQQLADFGRAGVNLLHDIANPLTAAALCLQEDSIHTDDGIQRARRNIETLQRYVLAARQQAHTKHIYKVFNVSDELQHLKDTLYPLAAQRGVRLRFAGRQDVLLHGDPLKFQQIIVNLATNAIEASENAGPPNKSAARVTILLSVSQDTLAITVRDSGMGIRPKDLPHIFEPFYSTKQKTEISGLGVGLYAAIHAAETVFGGTITAKSVLGKGTVFTVNLPRPAVQTKHTHQRL